MLLVASVQLSPVITSVKLLTNVIRYWRIFVIADIGKKRNNLKGPNSSILYWRISVTLGSGRAGFNCSCGCHKRVCPSVSRSLCPSVGSERIWVLNSVRLASFDLLNNLSGTSVAVYVCCLNNVYVVIKYS